MPFLPGQQRAQQQFPGPAEGQEERAGGMGGVRQMKAKDASHPPEQERAQAGLPAPQQHQGHRPEDVELFLDPQRPQMLQGF